MAEEIGAGVAANVIKSFTSRIWREIKYVYYYKSNIKKLREKVKALEDKKDTIELEVEAARNNADIIGPDVSGWQEKVDDIKIDANKVLECTMNAQWDCLYCKCPKPHSRRKLSKQALMKIGEINELIQEASNFGSIGHPATRMQIPFASPQEFDGFGSRVRIVNDVMEALKDNSITIIGICGMAGVGKTTLVKQIADKVKDTKVAMAVVSNDPSVAKIQDELAENLGLKIEKKTDRPRADLLYRRLMNKEENILIILDDLWQELDFGSIGIPVAGEREGVKVLLTSRYKDVCSDMRATTFEVKVLSKDESWHLFKEVAEISEEATDREVIAKEVANECSGLPLAIMTVGKALKNKNDHTWKEALQQLKESSVTSIRGIQDSVYSRIKLSYEYLENDDSRSLLLLCSLFPEDYNIPLEYLVKYVKGMQWYKNVETVARVRDKVYLIADELRSCNLLLAGDNEEYVKLHDVVRDVCLSITSSGDQKYMVRHGGLKEWPQEDSYAPYTAISLTFDEIDELPSGLDCPNLKLLRLNFREDELHIPEDFFKEMKELRVLEVSYLNSKLPSSLQSLVNLRTLCFHSCRLFGDISAIESLKRLEILRFYGSYVKHFPNEIVELCNLKILDLRCVALPSGVLGNLKKLEQLYMDSCDLEYLVDANKFFTGKRGAFINLEKFNIRNAKNLAELCHGNDLPPGSFARLREVRLFEVPALRHLWGAIQHPCLANLRILKIEYCGSIRSLFLQSSLECLCQLQKISISECPMLETLISNDEGDEENTRDIEFPQLKILNLYELNFFRSFSPDSGHETLFRKANSLSFCLSYSYQFDSFFFMSI